jgi:hypothetical protein
MMKTAIDRPLKRQSEREIFILDDEASAREAWRVILIIPRERI